MGAPSAGEVAARTISTLLDISECRAGLMASLSEAVADAVEELDPDHERDHRPTWWVDLPAWIRLDAFDRFRRAHDQLVVLEVQDGEVIRELRALLDPKAEHRAGFTPAAARNQMARMAERRAEYLETLRLALNRLDRARQGSTTGLTVRTAARVRQTARQLERYEQLAAADRARLGVLIAARSNTPATRAG